MLGDVNKLFVFKSMLTMPSSVLLLHLKQTFLHIIWIFTEGDGIKSRLPFKIFSTLLIKDVPFFLITLVFLSRQMTIVLMLLTKDISRPRNSIQKQKNWRHHSTYSVIQKKVKDIWKWLCLKLKPIWKVMNYKAIFYHLWLFQVDFIQ